jgi:hypothetical protein
MSLSVACDADLVGLFEHGAACVKVGRRSKRPLGIAWHESATTSPDVVAEWLSSGYNVGLLCGHGGLVDVEFDDAAGLRIVKQLGLLNADTPTYTSGRGEHRIFRLADPIPECGWRKIGGYEVRFGGLPAQSVLPPSRHPYGMWYSWTKSPCDYAPAVVTLAQLGLEDA